jgi:glutamate dehydrogenase
VEELGQAGVEAELAERLITLRFLPQLLNILRIAQEAGADAVETGRTYYLVSERFGCARLRHAIWGAATGDRWQTRLAQALVEDVERAQRGISRAVLACGAGAGGAEEFLDEFSAARVAEVAAYAAVFEEIHAADVVPLAGYAIAVRALLEVAGA